MEGNSKKDSLVSSWCILSRKESKIPFVSLGKNLLAVMAEQLPATKKLPYYSKEAK